MTIESIIQLLLASFCFSIILVYLVSRVLSGTYISFLTLMGIFVIADVYIPAIVGAITGKYLNYSYFFISKPDYYFSSLLVYSLSILLFLLGYFSKSSYSYSRIDITGDNRSFVVIERRLIIALVYAITVLLLGLFNEYSACGSWASFVAYKFKRIYAQSIEYNSFFKKVISFLNEFNYPVILIVSSIGLLNKKSLKHKKLWTIISPSFALFTALASIYRGAILEFVCMLIISLQLNYAQKKKTIPNSTRRKIRIMGMAAIVLFTLYGVVRNSLSLKAWGESYKLSLIESILEMFSETLGNSLSALARCLQWIDNGGVVFWGKSIWNMLYFFIPRFIWPQKPELYGIVTLTTSMGSPSTTMDAITIPGELIMNFWYFGLILLPVIGRIFRFLNDLQYSKRYKYLYSALMCMLVFSSLWMSFTGFFSRIKYYPIYILLINWVTFSRNKE